MWIWRGKVKEYGVSSAESVDRQRRPWELSTTVYVDGG